MNTIFNEQFDLYSFDIFDTLITRKVAIPNGIFALMQENINKSTLPDEFNHNFYAIRIDAECKARELKYQQQGTYEIFLEDIYKYMQQKFNLTNEDTNYLIQLELDTEYNNIIGIEENVETLRKHLNAGKRIILVSDMYLSSNNIRKLLLKIDSVFQNIKIYVSSEFNASKYDGNIYKIIKNKENVEYSKWCHYGDNITVDINNAQKLGIFAKRFKYSNLTAYEEILLNNLASNPNIQRIIGSARLTRLFNKHTRNRAKFNFGASFLAPILFNYVYDIIQTSIKRGFKTLYFISLDAYIPKIIAERIVQVLNLPINIKYIYGSRVAWVLPNENNYESLITQYFKEDVHKISLSILGYKLGIQPDILLKYTDMDSTNKFLSWHKRISLKESFLHNDELKQTILSNSIKRRQLLIKYLKQEIDFSQEDIAFVDVYGTAKTQGILAEELFKIKPCRIHGFYLSSLINDLPSTLVHKYFYFEYNTSYIFEILCRSDSGKTLDYKRNGDLIVPVFEDFDKNSLINWGFYEYLDGIIEFTNNYLSQKSCYCPKELSNIYYNYIMQKPVHNDARIIGNIPYTLDMNETQLAKAAPGLSRFNYLKLLLYSLLRIETREITLCKDISMQRGHKTLRIIHKLFNKQILPKQKDLIYSFRLLKLINKYKSKTIIFWGASIFLENFIKNWHIKSKNILGIVDRNTSKHGRKIGMYKIISQSELDSLNPDYVLFTVKHNNKKIYSDLSETKYYNKLLPNIFNDRYIELKSKQTKRQYKYICKVDSTELESLHKTTFLPFKNIHKNNEIVILGTGPSANFYEPIENAIHIGVNRAFSMNKVNLDYSFIQDYSGKTKEYIKALNMYNPSSCTKFYGISTKKVNNQNPTIPQEDAVEANALRYYLNDTDESDTNFAYDLTIQKLADCGSTVFSALQFALWTNPSTIYLVGCDCSLNGYAYDKYDINCLNCNLVIDSFRHFKKFAKKYYPNTKIISINPIELKGMFEEQYSINQYHSLQLQ